MRVVRKVCTFGIWRSRGGRRALPGCVRLLAVTSVTGGRWDDGSRGDDWSRGGEDWPIASARRPGSVRVGWGRPSASELLECDFRTRPTFGGYIHYRGDMGHVGGRWAYSCLLYTSDAADDM
eukprot:3447642-Prymnesium_polylepis.3